MSNRTTAATGARPKSTLRRRDAFFTDDVLDVALAHQPAGAIAQRRRARLRRFPRLHEPHPAKSWGLRESRSGSLPTTHRPLATAPPFVFNA